MDRVGILGGTFDPPHVAHIAMAEEAIREIPLEKVLFMPAPSPPRKAPHAVLPYALRLQMTELMVEGRAGFEVSRMEEFRDGPSFTVDLLRYYRRNYESEVFFIIGADSLYDFPSWRDPQGILELATLVVFPRTGFPMVLSVEGDASVVLFEQPVIDISSSDIRKILSAGEPAGRFLPKLVHDFILDKSLYT